MDTKQAIRSSLSMADMIVDGYLEDLKPEELFVRPVPGTNHIAWQLGHLISSDRWLMEKALPGKMEPLPEGFDAMHKKETAEIDDPAKFLTKEQYQRLAKQVRAQTLKLADALSPADFDKPVGGGPPMCKTVGDFFLFIGPHWLMHAGQWAVIRRKLGRPPLF